MTRWLKVVFVLLLVVGFLGMSVHQQPAYARNTMPLTFHGASSSVQFQGAEVWGIQSIFYVDDPGVRSNEEWDRWIYLDAGGGIQAGEGIEKCGGGSNCFHCGSYPGGNNHLFFFYNRNGLDSCFNIDGNGNINEALLFQVYVNQQNNGIEFLVKGTTGGFPCSAGAGGCSDTSVLPAKYTVEWYIENVHASFTTGQHLVFGGDWTQNMWRGSNFTDWKFRTSSGTVKAANPPQMGWNPPPLLGNDGGTLISCDYDNAPDFNSCVFRG